MYINTVTGVGILVVIATAISGYFMYYADAETREVKTALQARTSLVMDNTAIIKTNKGDIEIELFSELAPKTVENFTTLAKSGFYNGTKFHRVIAGFMIQGGDPLSKDDSQKDFWGRGGPGYTFEDEIHAENENKVGTIAMANAGPNTNGSQFFINVVDNDPLNPKHTVFGKVVNGMDVVKAIEATPTDAADRPVEDVVVESVVLK